MPSNFRDPVATIRHIADEIEQGTYGTVSCVGVVLLGDKMEVFGAGPNSREAANVALLLHAGFLRLSKTVEEWSE